MLLTLLTFGIALFLTIHMAVVYLMSFVNVLAKNNVVVPYIFVPLVAIAWTLYYWSLYQ